MKKINLGKNVKGLVFWNSIKAIDIRYSVELRLIYKIPNMIMERIPDKYLIDSSI